MWEWHLDTCIRSGVVGWMKCHVNNNDVFTGFIFLTLFVSSAISTVYFLIYTYWLFTPNYRSRLWGSDAMWKIICKSLLFTYTYQIKNKQNTTVYIFNLLIWSEIKCYYDLTNHFINGFIAVMTKYVSYTAFKKVYFWHERFICGAVN